jgi:hypothetical protein
MRTMTVTNRRKVLNEMQLTPSVASTNQSTMAQQSLITHADILARDVPPIAWDIEGLIPRGSRVVVFGPFGAMKSWLLESLGLSLASGTPWLDTFAIPQPRRVLYLDQEQGRTTVWRRVKRLSQGLGLQATPFVVVPHLSVRFKDDQDVVHALATPQCVDSLGGMPEVVIVETLRRVLAGSENNAEDVAKFWQATDTLVAQGMTVVVAHHYKKARGNGSQAKRDMASGSTDLLAGADVAFAVEPSKDPGHVLVQCVKMRDAAEPPPFQTAITWDDPMGPVVLEYAGPPTNEDPTAVKLQTIRGQVEDFLVRQPRHQATAKLLVAELVAKGTAKRTVERLLKRLVETDQIVRPETGVYALPPMPLAA